MKKICIILPSLLPVPAVNGGAIETLIEYIILENEQKKKLKISILTVENEEALKKEKEYRYTDFIHYKNFENRLINYLYKQIYRILKEIFKIYIPCSINYIRMLRILKKNIKKYDYIIYEAGETSQIPVIAKFCAKKKLFVHLHWSGIWNRANIKKIDSCFNKLIPVSNYIGKNWIKETGRKDNEVVTLSNCVNLERFTKKLDEKDKVELKNRLGIPLNNKVIIFTGRIIKEKGVEELLLAFNNIKIPNVSLLIIGSANFGVKTKTKYENKISSLIKKIKKQIIFSGFVKQTDLYKYYSISDIAVMPSLFQDPAPLVCIETQAAGIPLIASKVGGVSEYISENGVVLIDVDSNFVENLTKQIENTLDDDNKRKLMSLAEINKSKEFSIEKYYSDFCNIMYEDF